MLTTSVSWPALTVKVIAVGSTCRSLFRYWPLSIFIFELLEQLPGPKSNAKEKWMVGARTQKVPPLTDFSSALGWPATNEPLSENLRLRRKFKGIRPFSIHRFIGAEKRRSSLESG